MDVVLLVLAILFALNLFHGLSMISRMRKKLPPGPMPLPLIGNLHLLGSQPHKSLAKLAKSHGPIMSLQLGCVTTVVITSSSLAHQVLQKQDLEFSSRYIPDAVHALDHSKYSVVWLPVSSQWRSLRKMFNSNIFSSNRLDTNQVLRLRKVEELVAYCRQCSNRGESVDIGQAAFTTSLNLLSNTILSKDLADHHSDSVGKEFKEVVSKIMVEVGKVNLVDYFPILARLDPQGIRRRLAIHLKHLLKQYVDIIDERLDHINAQGVVTNDVLDALLTAAQKCPQEIDRTLILHICMDLFAAGTNTTSDTLEWAMAELLRNPEVMEKAKEELKRVMGKGKMIKETDIQKLPYLNCIVKETLRLHPPVPFLIPRKVEQDVHISKYVIPNKSQVLVNAWAIGRDPTLWENPLMFNPERFYKSEMDVRGHDFELIPFGGGRRICPGLALAMRMIPQVLGSLLNTFDWKLEDGTQLHMEERFGLTMQKAQPLIVVPVST